MFYNKNKRKLILVSRDIGRKIVVALICLGLMNYTAFADPGIEYKVKAAFVANFIKFIEWPNNPDRKKDSHFRIGMLGNGPLKQALNSIEGKQIRGKSVALVSIESMKDIQDLDILVICPTLASQYIEIFSQSHGKAILTIGDSDDFCLQGGMIEFYLKNGKVRFAINLKQVRSEGIQISSKMLKLSKIVN